MLKFLIAHIFNLELVWVCNVNHMWFLRFVRNDDSGKYCYLYTSITRLHDDGCCGGGCGTRYLWARKRKVIDRALTEGKTKDRVFKNIPGIPCPPPPPNLQVTDVVLLKEKGTAAQCICYDHDLITIQQCRRCGATPISERFYNLRARLISDGQLSG